ncbi:MAG: HNH endonuclease [Xanthomonadaceae bacterium]|nr:HNH endonuclease [Xanthomonadaceae bacterium]
MISETANVSSLFPSRGNWTREQLKLAFYLYCQLPFGRLHRRNQAIVDLAGLIGRSPDALAMKLVNFASLDPAITRSGRSGLSGASRLDREVWDEFHADWEELASECAQLMTALRERLLGEDDQHRDDAEEDSLDLADHTGQTRVVLTHQRIKQQFFRRAVLSSYHGRCCMSGLSETQLLVAGHIVPWRSDTRNRLNPRNGLCLSAIHDRAFDRGLVALTDDLRVIVSDRLLSQNDEITTRIFRPLLGQQIELPEKFAPDPTFIRMHRECCFLGG